LSPTLLMGSLWKIVLVLRERKKAPFVTQFADNLSEHTLMRALHKTFVRIALFL
jgi:hypothetical protein